VRGGAQQRPARGRDLETEVSLSFAQAVSGTQVALSVPTSQPCPTCQGSGAKPGTSPRICPVCNGTGMEAQSQGIFSMSQPCSNCHGQGTVIDDPCPTCHGSGAQRSIRRLRANIPAGVREGSRIRLPGKGEPGLRGAEPGDLYVITRVAESPVFKRVGDNLEVEVPLTIPEALLGAIIEVPTLSGTKRLKVARGTKSGTVQRLRGEGPPRLGGKGRGDIRYRFVLDVPASLTDEQAAAVDRLARVLDTDPRARLLRDAAAATNGNSSSGARPRAEEMA
jgi:molecular chaperone DnaJ